MKITDLQVDGFGVWNELTIDELSPEMTVFFGRNEAGKTTLMQFIRSELYGYTPERRHRYLPPVFGGIGGGSLYVATGDQKLQIQRHDRSSVDRAYDLVVGDLAVISSQGHQYGGDYLERLLAGVNETVYNNVFAIGLHEIQELSGLDATEAARELYKLASGVDRVSLIDVMQQLEHKRAELLEGIASARSRRDDDGETREKEIVGKITQLLRREKELRRDLDNRVHGGRQWVALIDQRKDLERELRDQKTELGSLESRARTLELATQIHPTVRRMRSIESELELLDRLPDERDLDVKKLERLQDRTHQLDRMLDQIAAEAEGVKASAERLPLNRAIIKQATRIETLSEHQQLFGSIGRQADRLRDEVKRLELELQELGGTNRVDAVIDRATLARLTGPVKSLRNKRRELEHAEREVGSAEQEVARLKAVLDDAMVANNCESLGDSFQEAGHLVALLRKRQTIDEKIDRLNQQRKAAEAELDITIQNQVFSPERLFAVGGFVVVGVALILGGWSAYVINWLPANPLMGFFGCGVVLAGMGLKKYWEYESQDEVDRAKALFDQARNELAKAKIERDELDQRLPAGFGQIDGRLVDAQRRLGVLEKLLPMDGRVSEAASHLQAMQQRAEQCRAELEAAEQRWQRSLTELGLDTDLSPTQVRQLSEKSVQIEQTRNRLIDTRRQLDQYDDELDGLRTKIITLHEEFGLESESDDPLDLLKQLESEVRSQRSLMEQRQEFAKHYQSLRSRRTQIHGRLQKLKLFKTRLLAKVGAETDQEFRAFAEKHVYRRKLLGEVETLQQKIRAILGEQVDREAVMTAVDEHDAKQLEVQWEGLGRQIDQLKATQETLHEKRGELSQLIKQQGESDELEQAKLELDQVLRELDEARRKWQEFAAASRILESLREFYETHRQPDTLKNASKYLTRMTGGKYIRIWTRMSGNALLVDGSEEKGLSVEVLSRGTREAVFLALRLALVDAYQKRGIRLPMVLDDVLVNFDAERAKWAGEVLRDFAQRGHQLLMFTCHAHMAELFEALGCDVRVLPYHRDVVHKAATVVTKADDHLIVEEILDEPSTTVSHSAIEQIEELEQQIEEELTVEPEPVPEPVKKKKKKRPPIVEAPKPEPEPERVETVVSVVERERVQWDAPGLWWEGDQG